MTYIDTSPKTLWRALTTPEYTEKYWGGRRIESEWDVGSPVVHRTEDGQWDWQGEVLEFDAPNLLAYTFQGPDAEDTASRVTIRLQTYGDVVRVLLNHDELADEDDLRGISQGWPAILSSLKSLLETGDALEYPWKG